ncbi:MAG: type II restriction endonuclease [Deltaproteobacteria bacterium]|nr:type II restriction endonuclease [Deltaproteobacteria bacterium]
MTKEIDKKYPDGFELGIVGILFKSLEVYTLSHDSKILSGIFEILCEPLVRSIAEENGFILKKAAQNAYPDFTIFNENEPEKKYAIEVKSTYRQYTKKNTLKKFGFTLGSYKSYLRDLKGKKGILYPYSDYIEHWVIGFLYSRNPNCSITEIRRITEASQLEAPYTDIEYFVQQKHLISGEKPGSGNTTNIGSMKSADINDFRNGIGPFKTKREFEEYWKTY